MLVNSKETWVVSLKAEDECLALTALLVHEGGHIAQAWNAFSQYTSLGAQNTKAEWPMYLFQLYLTLKLLSKFHFSTVLESNVDSLIRCLKARDWVEREMYGRV